MYYRIEIYHLRIWFWRFGISSGSLVVFVLGSPRNVLRMMVEVFAYVFEFLPNK